MKEGDAALKPSCIFKCYVAIGGSGPLAARHSRKVHGTGRTQMCRWHN